MTSAPRFPRAHAATLAASSAVLLLLLAALPPAAGAAEAPRPSPGLDRFESCAEMVAYLRSRAPRLAKTYGALTLPPPRPGAPMPIEEGDRTSIGGDAAQPAVGVPGVDHSETNNQEAGVDEPDTVKTDGRRMFVVDGGARLRILDVSGGVPRLVGSLELPTPSATGLLLSGDRLLVLSEPEREVRGLRAAAGAPLNLPSGGVQLILLDVADLTTVRVLDRYVLSGWLLGARLTGTTVRVVTQAAPSLTLRRPAARQAQARPARAQALWRRALKRSTKANWLPVAKRLRSDGTSTHGPAVGCRGVHRPLQFSGAGTTTVSTIDLTSGLAPTDVDAVLADGGILYASPTGLYVATQRSFDWTSFDEDEPPPALDTVIHRFDTSAATATAYRGSGTVRGTLLNQFSMSEFNGVLRVASTEIPPWWQGDVPDSESFVTTLAERDGALAQVGRVGGLGKGERIYAVRFIGDRGYVVTFRQVDPLYVVDLADPANPAVRGELKIRGYSAYLHPVGDGLLLGVGQDATAEGRVLGTQVALFDVKDPAAPTRLSVLTLPGGWSDAEWDHHAFLWWPASGLAVMPVAVWPVSDRPDSSFVGALAVAADRAGGVREAGRVVHPFTQFEPPPMPVEPGGAPGGAPGVAPGAPSGERLQQPTPIQRSLVVGDSLLTVSALGVKASRLSDLTDVAWAPFPVDPQRGGTPIPIDLIR